MAPKTAEIIDERLKSLFAAALQDPHLPPDAKSLAGYALNWLSDPANQPEGAPTATKRAPRGSD